MEFWNIVNKMYIRYNFVYNINFIFIQRVLRMLFAQTLLSKEREKVTYVSEHRSCVRHCRLPVVTYFEDGEYIAECPLFYVSSHGDTPE